jgi:hypothetical protein
MIVRMPQCQKFAMGNMAIALIQEPWNHRGQMRGLTNFREQYFDFS